MKITEIIRSAFEAIAKNKVRSCYDVGDHIGVAAVIVMVSISADGSDD